MRSISSKYGVKAKGVHACMGIKDSALGKNAECVGSPERVRDRGGVVSCYGNEALPFLIP